MCISPATPQGKGPLVAVDGDTAVLAFLAASRLHLVPVDPANAVAALVEALPTHQPGRGSMLRFSADELTEDGARVRVRPQEGSVLLSGRTTESDADRYLKLMRRPRAGMIYLYAEHHGRRARPVVVLDIEGDGRWLVSRNAAGPTEWISAAPGSPRALVEQLAAS
jgi:hypothetical protein